MIADLLLARERAAGVALRKMPPYDRDDGWVS
jgi:hypothetical protein